MAAIQNKVAWAVVGALCLLVIAMLAGLVNAGPLDPPGPVAPTGKTQINTLPFTISAPGSYILEKNLNCADYPACAAGGVSGITIAVSDVTLDLNGFQLKGAPGSLKGAVTGVVSNVSVSNGTVRDWGSDGIDASVVSSSTFDDLRVQANGGAGVLAGTRGLVSGSNVWGNSGFGIVASSHALISNNIVTSNLAGGIAVFVGKSQVVGNNVVGNSVGGILVSGGNVRIADNNVSANGGDGIFTTLPGSNYSVTGNNVSENAGNGIVQAGTGSTVANNTASGNALDGIKVTGNGNRIDENHVDSSGVIGIEVAAVASNANLIMRNTSEFNAGVPYSIGAGNQETGDGALTTLTNPWDNISD